MTYTVNNITQATAKTGKHYQRANLTDSNGQTFEFVSAFNSEFTREGMSIDGFLEAKDYNGKTYYTFKSIPSTGGKTAQIEKVMEKKNESIANFQDAKEKAIQHAGAITNATNFFNAMIIANAKYQVAKLTEEEARYKLREFIIFYQQLYKNPDSINPAASDDPFGMTS